MMYEYRYLWYKRIRIRIMYNVPMVQADPDPYYNVPMVQADPKHRQK